MDSVNVPIDRAGATSGTASPPTCGRATSGSTAQEVTLDTLDEALDGIVAGSGRGRWIVRIGE